MIKPDDAARALLAQIALPRGSVSVLPWHEADCVVMHVLVEQQYMHCLSVPAVFEGYAVQVDERHIPTASKFH
jgi:hypothetical protein